MSPYVEQVAEAIAFALCGQNCCGACATKGETLAPRVDAALMRAYWQGWDDGLAQRREIQPSGAAGRGVLAALGELRGPAPAPHTPTPEPRK